MKGTDMSVISEKGTAYLHKVADQYRERGGVLLPTADFTFVADGLEVTFTSTSSDVDGTIEEYEWDFGDEAGTATTADPVYTYAEAGTYTVTLTVTDDKGDTGKVSKTVEVS